MWSLTAPLGALVFAGRANAFRWFMAYIALLLVSMALEGQVRIGNNLSERAVTTFFVMNIAGMSVVAFVLVRYFVGEKNLSLRLLESRNQWIKDAFSAYLSPNLVDHLVTNPTELTLSGERRDCSFVFTDLVGFTSLVERTPPEDWTTGHWATPSTPPRAWRVQTGNWVPGYARRRQPWTPAQILLADPSDRCC